MKKVNVVEVKCPPAIGKPEMMGGIRMKEEAEHWAAKSGYATVYWLKSRQRVYADKLTKDLTILAKQVETKASHLVRVSEGGQGLVEILLLLAIVVIAMLLLGKCTGLPM